MSMDSKKMKSEPAKRSSTKYSTYSTMIIQVAVKKLGGTLSVTDLWSNATSVRYLK